MAKKKKNNVSDAQKVGIGVGLTAAAVAAAGTYFLYGSKNAAKNRSTVKSWALKAKAEVLEALENAQEMTWEEYADLIDSIAAAYATANSSTKKEIAAFKREMKDHWASIEKSAKKTNKSVKKSSKTAPKKAAKKSAKKATKKK